MWEDWQDMANSSLSAASGSKAGGCQLSEERRERSGRASSYDPVLSLGRCAMSRPRDPGISADIPGPLPTTPLYTLQKTRSGLFSPTSTRRQAGIFRIWYKRFSASEAPEKRGRSVPPEHHHPAYGEGPRGSRRRARIARRLGSRRHRSGHSALSARETFRAAGRGTDASCVGIKATRMRDCSSSRPSMRAIRSLSPLGALGHSRIP